MKYRIVISCINISSLLFVLGVVFAIFNSVFVFFQNVVYSNLIVAFVVGVCMTISTIANNLLEYSGKNYPKKYLIWSLVYPLFLFGSILTLLYINFLPIENKIINFIMFFVLLSTLFVEYKMGEKYDHE